MSAHVSFKRFPSSQTRGSVIGFRIDLIVENKVLVEIKSVEALNDIHTAQVLTYLKLSGCKLGLLMNFNVLRVKDGIKRLVNNL